ncbi:MAG: hypothetical protein HUU35_07400 [Armatimonadetes bacterium]|nr:hypothetical protein [Armatimonadota bacterium]
MSRRLMLAAGLSSLLVIPAALRAAVESGPAKDGSAPMLHVDAFNDGERGGYCLTCSAGKKPTVVAFVRSADDPTKALLGELARQAESHKDQKLGAAVVIVGEGQETHALRSFIESEKLAIPAAVVPGGKELEKWRLNAEVGRTVVLIREHTVRASLADPSTEDVASQVGELCE